MQVVIAWLRFTAVWVDYVVVVLKEHSADESTARLAAQSTIYAAF
jgi:hypothetical protein